ncbi:hypothetical protein BN169_900101 [Clostridioides difficile E16]|nr:hypothetical protein QCW_3641 [Clostridioides difficile CD69]CCL12871.1 hypothetical protein BN169_900101 [Clostridioides difficile E16]
MECYFSLVRKVYIIVERDYSLKLCIFKQNKLNKGYIIKNIMNIKNITKKY